MGTPDNPLPAQLEVVAWPDPVLDALGFLPHDPYSELVATPTLGPSAVLAWRRLAGTLIHRPDGFTLEVGELAHALGHGTGTAHRSPICRTLRRLVAFDLARFIDESTYAVRRRTAPAASSQLRRPSPELRWRHNELLARHDEQRLAARAQQVHKGA